MSRVRAVSALSIRGLPHFTDLDTIGIYQTSAPVLLTNGDLNALPAALTGSVVNPLLDPSAGSISGYGWQTGFRDPASGGAFPSFRVIDLKDGPCKCFAEDPALQFTSVWTLEKSYYAKTTTSFRLFGSAVPTLNQILWIGSEAVKISAVSINTATDFTITVTRGVLGSRAIKHEIDPCDYPSGEDGAFSFLFAYSRPQWGRVRRGFECAFYLLNGETGAILEAPRFGFLSSPPVPDRGRWSIQIEDVSRVISEHRFGRDNKEIPISRAIQVLDVDNFALTGTGEAPVFEVVPKRIRVFLSRLEAEKIFRKVFHQPGNGELSDDFASTLQKLPDSVSFPEISSLLRIQAGGADLLFLIEKAQYSTETSETPSGQTQGERVIFVECSLLFRDRGTSIASDPITQPLTAEGSERFAGLNAGWSNLRFDPIRQDEEPPKITFRQRVTSSFYKFFLYVLFSSEKTALTDFDKLWNFTGLDLDQSWFAIGATGTLPIDERTHEILKIDQLFSQKRTFFIDPELELKTFLESGLLSSCCLLAPFDDGIGVSVWAKSDVFGSPKAPDLLIGADDLLRVEGRLPRLSVITIFYGVHPITLKATRGTVLRLPDATEKDFAEGQAITLHGVNAGYATGTGFAGSSTLSQSQNFIRLSSVFLRQLSGEPSIYRFSQSLLDSDRLQIGDLCTISDRQIPTPQGRGATNLKCVTIGKEIDPETGKITVFVLRDFVNLASRSNGNLAPALEILYAEAIDKNPDTYRLAVRSIGDDAFNILTSYNGIYQTLVANGALVRLRNAGNQNLFVNNSRRGWLEAYAILQDAYISGGYSWIRVKFSTDMSANSRAETICESKHSFVLFPDVYQTSLDGPIVPDSSLLFTDGEDYIKVAPQGGFPILESHLNTIDA